MAVLHLGVLASHGGTNLRRIIDACKEGLIHAQCRVVISNNSGSMALLHAKNDNIPHYHLSGKTHASSHHLDQAIRTTLEKHGVNLVILAGYLKLLGPLTVSHYQGRILNIHPSLLPRFGGKGMHGDKVHEAVLASGDAVTGVTIHQVDKEYDHGPTIAQTQVPVLWDDSIQSLRGRVLRREHEFYVETLRKIAEGDISLIG